MAKIEVEGVLGDIRGQMGGYIVSKNGETKYIRQKRKKKNNHTKPRQRTESSFGELTKIWKTLSIIERRSWELLFKSGHIFTNKKEKRISDRRYLFIGLNMNKIQINEPINRIAPPLEQPQGWFGAKAEIIIKRGNLSMNLYLLNKIEPNTKLILMATPSLTNPSEKINKREYRQIKVLDSNFVSGSSINEDYLRVFGKIGGVGEEFGFKIRPIHKFSGINGILECFRATITEVNNQ